MVETVLKGIITLEIFGIMYFVFRTVYLYFKYRYGENKVEENEIKVGMFLDKPEIVEKIRNLKEIPYQG